MTAEFLTAPKLAMMPDGESAVLLDNFTYVTEVDYRAFGLSYQSPLIAVPAGFVTDFASVPRVFWSLVPKMGRQAYPAIIHDYLYENHIGSRKWADAVFLEALKVNGANLFTRMVCWAAVRIGGRKSWG